MKGEIKASISAIAAAVMLVACASKPPEHPTVLASADTSAQDKTASETQRLIDNVSNQLICKRQAVTGTRVDRQVCVTKAQMEEQRANADQVMREMRDSQAARQQFPDRPQMPQPPPRSTP